MTNSNAPGTASSDNRAAGEPGDRRLAPRRTPGLAELLRRVRSRTGREFDVVDVSDTGLLIEGRTRLLPNTHVEIHIVTRTGRVLVRCRVVRSYVWYLEADLVRYRVGVSFDRQVETSAGYPVPAPLSTLDQTGTRYPLAAAHPPAGSALEQSSE